MKRVESRESEGNRGGGSESQIEKDRDTGRETARRFQSPPDPRRARFRSGCFSVADNRIGDLNEDSSRDTHNVIDMLCARIGQEQDNARSCKEIDD